MRALSLYAPYAMLVACNCKTIEVRSWKTNIREEILICSTVEDKNYSKMKDCYIFGHAIAIARIDDCRPLTKDDFEAAFLDDDFDETGMYAIVLKDIELIEPIKVKGQQRFFNVDIEPKRLGIYPKEEDDCQEVYDYWLANNYVKELPWDEEE